MNRIRSLGALLGLAVAAACSKDALQSITAPAPGAYVKFFNFGVGAPGVNFYANDTKVTAITSTTDTVAVTGTTPGNAGAGGFYTVLAPGAYTLSGRIAAATDNSLAVATLPATLVDGKSYSFYMSGIYNGTTKTSDSFLIEDPLSTTIDFTKSYVRFVNASANAGPQTLYIKGADSVEVALNTAVPYKGAGTFTAVPAGVYNVYIRFTQANVVTTITRTALSFTNGHVYTVGLRGDITVTSTTSASRLQFDLTANR